MAIQVYFYLFFGLCEGRLPPVFCRLFSALQARLKIGLVSASWKMNLLLKHRIMKASRASAGVQPSAVVWTLAPVSSSGSSASLLLGRDVCSTGCSCLLAMTSTGEWRGFWGAALCMAPFSAGWDVWENKDALAERSGEPLWLLGTRNVLGGQPVPGSYFQSHWGLATSGFRVYHSPLLALMWTVSLVRIARSFAYLLPCTLQHLWGTDKSALGDVTCDSIYKHLTQSSFYLSPVTPPEELHQSLAVMLFIPASVRVAFWFYFFVVVVLGVFI